MIHNVSVPIDCETCKPTWDDTFFALMEVISLRSDDQRTKVGCVIVREDNTVVSLGYNGAPRGVDNARVGIPLDQDQSVKYPFVEHADRNAIFNAHRVGVSVFGCTMYLPWLPCAECSRAIIQSGIAQVVVLSGIVEQRWRESCYNGMLMMEEAGVCVRARGIGGLTAERYAR